jgi:uncharacterized hydrophobic protein (TIGR00271 family)
MNTEPLLRPSRAAAIQRWWRRDIVGGIDHATVAARIDADSNWSLRYLFMVVMSAGIAILGLLQSSPAVVIGAMLISPLMGPIIGLGFALALLDLREIRTSLLALALGSLVAVAITALIVLASPLQGVTPEILARTRPNLFDLLVAVFSALAGTYATIRGRGETVVGVAIATALMPPLAVVGFGLATLNLAIFGGALALFLTNFLAIALTAALMARLYGFAEHISPRQTSLQNFVIGAVFLIMAIPLALSLRQIAAEAITTRQLRSAISAEFGSSARISQLDINHAAKPVTASAVVVIPVYRDGAEARILDRWRQSIDRNAAFTLSQLVANQDLPRLDQERSALAEASRRQTLDSVTATSLTETVSLATGTRETDIVIDLANHRLVAVPPPGTALATIHATERRLAERHPDWTVRLVPPVTTRLEIGFAPGSARLEGEAAADLERALWALARWRATRVSVGSSIPSREDGPASLADARSNAVAVALREAGIIASPSGTSPAGGARVQIDVLG